MTDGGAAEHFFPPRAERGVLEFVLQDFPFPLALTYARLQEELDRQEPIAAAWQLRDAFECLIKFCAGLAVADLLHAGTDRDTSAKVAGLLHAGTDRDTSAEVASLLLKPQGLSLGDWYALIEIALKPLEPLARAGRPAEGGRCLPELFGVFFELKGRRRRSALGEALAGNADNFVAWRNRVFGHGVFSQDRGWYAEQTVQRLGTLHRFYEALRPVLAGWALISVTPGGEELLWQGSEGLPPAPRHEHEPEGEPLPMLLAPRPANGRATLPLGPLLSVQSCAICGQPAAFFFDRHRYEREKDRHRGFFLEYFRGHSREQRDWAEARRLAALLPAEFKWERGTYDIKEVEEGIGIVFRDFESEYLRPDYLADAVWRTVEEQTKGYIELRGPGGAGKTYFVRGLEREGAERSVPVLAYYILPGALSSYHTFLIELAQRARELLRFQTEQAQSRVASLTELQEQFAEFLRKLMRDNRLETLVVAIDALDELPEPEPGSAAITDFLPLPADLPEGCFVLLTSREVLRPRIRAAVERLRLDPRSVSRKGGAAAAPPSFTLIELSPKAPANRELLRAYLAARLPEQFRRPEHIEEVLARSGGVFLYAYHLCRALESGAFTDLATLPTGDQFYPAYLARLRERVGDHLYESVYLPALLFLAAAQVSVTLEQLSRWGVPRERLQFALLDLRDFLRVQRVRLWHESLAPDDGESRYELAHEAFLRYLQGDAPLAASLRDAHATIARLALAEHAGRWEAVEPTDDADLYDLRFLPAHLHAAGLVTDQQALHADEHYARGCLRCAYAAQEKARYHLALNLYDRGQSVFTHLVQTQGQHELVNELAGALMIRGNALSQLGRLPEALAA